MVRTLHAAGDEVEVVAPDEEVVAVGDVVVGLDGFVVGGEDVVVVDGRVVGVDVVDESSVGATATGPSPTRESAALTICHVSNVVTTRAPAQTTAAFHENMTVLSHRLRWSTSRGAQGCLKGVVRSALSALLSPGAEGRPYRR